MAKMLKKLQQKMTPAEKPKPVRPPGKDYMLLILMAFTVMVVLVAWDTLDSLTLTMYVLLTASLGLAAWENLDALTLIMYILLTLSLGLTYIRRQAVERLSEFQMMIVTRASFVTIGMAGALFLIDAYRRFFA